MASLYLGLASRRLRLACHQPRRGAAWFLADRLGRRADASTGGITGAASASASTAAAAAASAAAVLAAAAWALSTTHDEEGGISPWLSASATAACDAAEKEGVASAERCISLAEFLANDGSDGRCWVSVNGGVYDVTAFLSAHPGGSATLLAYVSRPQPLPSPSSFFPFVSSLPPSSFPSLSSVCRTSRLTGVLVVGSSKEQTRRSR